MKPTAVRFDVRVRERSSSLWRTSARSTSSLALNRTLSSSAGRRQQITKPLRERGKRRMTRRGSWVGSSRRDPKGTRPRRGCSLHQRRLRAVRPRRGARIGATIPNSAILTRHRQSLKMLIGVEGAHAFCVSIFGRVEHLPLAEPCWPRAWSNDRSWRS